MSKKLHKELHMQRVSKQEAVDLAEVAAMIAVVNPPGLSSAARQRIADRLPVDVDLDEKPKKHFIWGWAAAGVAGSFAVLFIIMTSLAQSALPDPTVYHAKDDEEKTKQHHKQEVQTEMDQQSVQQLESETDIKPTETPKADSPRRESTRESRRDNDRNSRNDRNNNWSNNYRSWWGNDRRDRD